MEEEEEDSGQLLDSSADLDSSQSQDQVIPRGNQNQNQTNDPLQNGNPNGNPNSASQVVQVLKNCRSKSLPASSYFPQIRSLQNQHQQLLLQKKLQEKCAGENVPVPVSVPVPVPASISSTLTKKMNGLTHSHNNQQSTESETTSSSADPHQHSLSLSNSNSNSNSLSNNNNNTSFNKNQRLKNSHVTGGHAQKRNEQDVDSKKMSEWRTLQTHYYPEGGFGWIVCFCALLSHAISLGTQFYLSNVVYHHFHKGSLGAMSMGVSLFFSPVWVSICKRKSTRLAAVFGGLVASLGCLFTSFASQYHQLFLSYGAFLGVGVGLSRDASSLMVGQYFKRRREIVEIIVVSGSGLGILLMSIFIHVAISSFGWRLGLQAVTGSLFLTFFLGTFYRSASLYHPQRRAILHLKNQRNKVKDKEKREEKPPFLDCSCLRSKTLQILLLSSALTAFGINTPLFYLVSECKENRVDEISIIVLHVYVGAGWIIGCSCLGLLAIQKNQECRVSKQYLCQVASLICGMSILALTAVKGFNGLVIFSWIYGFSLGGYNYALKVYTYERVRARHFPRAWSFIQCSQSIPLVTGVIFSGYLNSKLGFKSGYYFSTLLVVLGSAMLFLTDVRKRRLSRKKTQSSIKTNETLESAQSPKLRRLSFSFPVEQMSPNSKGSKHGDSVGHAEEVDQDLLDPNNILKELTCISEEGIADIDFQDIYFEEWEEYFGADCITSCAKVENCLVSEYDPDYPALLESRRGIRRWSAARPNLTQAAHAGIGSTVAALAGGVAGLGGIGSHNSPHHHIHSPPTRLFPPIGTGREIPIFRNHRRPTSHAQPTRAISIIDEASI